MEVSFPFNFCYEVVTRLLISFSTHRSVKSSNLVTRLLISISTHRSVQHILFECEGRKYGTVLPGVAYE